MICKKCKTQYHIDHQCDKKLRVGDLVKFDPRATLVGQQDKCKRYPYTYLVLKTKMSIVGYEYVLIDNSSEQRWLRAERFKLV